MKVAQLRERIDGGAVIECFIKNPVSGVSERRTVERERWSGMYILKIYHAPRPGERAEISEIPHFWCNIVEGVGTLRPDGWEEVKGTHAY